MAPDGTGPSWALPTPFGAALRLQADAEGRLVAASFQAEPSDASAPPERIRDPIEAYLEDPAGGLPDLPVALPEATAFRRRVWEALREIPAGAVRTYGDVAAAAGSPEAARAAGQAVAENPLVLLVPCHRVVPASGGVGGYSAAGGPARKAQILAAEGAPVAEIERP